MSGSNSSGDPSIRWSPHSSSSSSRFMRIDSRKHEFELTFYDVETIKGKNIKSKETSLHPKIKSIRCFDWSTSDEDLVCIGQTDGVAKLIRAGHAGGINLPVKHQRSCNSVSFNSDGRFVATGLDKVRNDTCLNIWDVHQVLSQPASEHGPSRKLASSETITSVRFSRDNPNTLVTGMSYKLLKLWDLRESPSNPVLQYQTRCVHNISLDKDPNYFASHSDEGIISVWDRRFARLNPAGEPALCFSRPADASMILSLRYSNDRSGALGVLTSTGELRVYETSKISDQEPLMLSGSSMSLNHGLNSENGVIDAQKPRGGWRESASSLLEAGRAYGGTSTSGTRTPSNRADGETLFVTRKHNLARPSRKGDANYEKRVTSFDWMSGEDHGTMKLLTLRRDDELEVMSCPSPVPSLAWGSRNEFLVTSEKDLKMIPTPDTRSDIMEEKPRKKSITPDDEDEEIPQKYTYTVGGSSPEQRLGLHEKRRLERSNSIVRPEDYLLDADEVIKNDICVTMKRRLESGYEMNCQANASMTHDERGNPYLNDMWVWLDGARECAVEGGMTSGPLDLSYIGVYGVWHGGKESTPESRLTVNKKVGREDWTRAIANINKECGRKPFKDYPTGFPEQRRLCLAICDWNYDAEELEYELEELETSGDFTKAAGWALFYGHMDRCIQSLRRGGQQLRIMATAVAGYFAEKRLSASSSSAPDHWKTFASELATELHDPHLRSIFAYVSTGDWKEVLDEIGLPLRERMGIALRWLPDSELTNFLETATKRSVDGGELEGIVLTGLTPRAVDLLQVYIDRTGDVQTAALVASFAVPRYFRDDRVTYWVESYRQLLNSWRAFHHRARFDVARGRHSRNRAGVMTMDAPKRQVYVRCANCDRSISHNPSSRGSSTQPGKKDSKLMALRDKQSSAAMSGGLKPTGCPHCKKALPRCAVCLLNLGTPAVGGRSRLDSGATATTVGVGDVEEDYDRWFNFCLACNHGMHAGHARDWFARHQICPVPDCTCACKM